MTGASLETAMNVRSGVHYTSRWVVPWTTHTMVLRPRWFWKRNRVSAMKAMDLVPSFKARRHRRNVKRRAK